MLKAYKALSIIISPPAMALYVILAFSLFSPIGIGSLSTATSIAIGMVFLVIIPILSAYFLRKKIIDIERSERTIPYLISIAGYTIASALFWYMGSKIMFLISVSYFSVVSAILVINMFWKISAHAAGTAGPTTALIYVFGIGLTPLYVLTLLIMWARFKLNVHSALQVITGSVVAIFITSLVYTILW